MDIATIIGFILVVISLSYGVISGSGMHGFLAFFDIPSMFIVIGGTTAVVFILSPLEHVLNTIQVLEKTFFHRTLPSPYIIEQMTYYATRARREGILALEEEANKQDDPFLRRGIQLAVDGTGAEAIKMILENELAAVSERHKDGQNVLTQAGVFAPAFGLLGTLIGLILMLGNLNDPKTLGPNMAVALITTLYGALIANAICLPLAQKLKTRSKEEQMVKGLIVEGILSIQSGDNPRLVEEKLNTFLSPKNRITLADKRRPEYNV